MKYFNKEEVYNKTFEYFGGDELATKVWISKYCLTDSSGNFLEDSPPMMFERLAKEFSRIENNYKNPINYGVIIELLKDFKYVIPGGSILYGLGNDFSISSLGNCFVIGNTADSYGGILLSDQEQIQLMKRRAGVGQDLSHIRPKGSPTTNSSKTSTGIVPFMRRYSNSTLEVAQDGRRGALMLTINIDHPEVENFITAKDKEGEIEGANISVKVTDEFIEEVRADNPKAKKIWNKLVHQAWKSADPGILFIDTIRKESPADCYKGFTSVSSNPCGEIPLCQYDSCRLMSINLASFVISPFEKVTNIINNFDFDHLSYVAYNAQKLMDDIVDLEYEKITKILKKIESDPETDEVKAIEKALWTKIVEKLNRGRRTGLSGIGLADVFANLNIKYDSSEALLLSREIYKCIALASYRASIDMARDRGSFPDFDFFREQHNPFVNRILNDLEKAKVSEYLAFGRRNIANLTIPPSGTISLISGITSGIEPVFAVLHKRRRKVDSDWEEHLVLHRGFLRWYKYYKNLQKVSDIEVREILNKLSKEELDELLSLSPYAGSAAHEINYDHKVTLQGIIQKWVDHSISVTQNLPENATEEQVSRLMLKAHDAGCKGITIYRDGCKTGVLKTLDSENLRLEEVNAPKRPKDLFCDIFFPKIKGEEYVVLVGLINNKPYEVFCFKNYGLSKNIVSGVLRKMDRGHYNLLNTNKQDIIVENITSKFEKPVEEFATRIISTALRHGTPVRFVVEQLNKSEGEIFSYSKVISRTLKKYIQDGIKASGVECPECKNNTLIYKSGCIECVNCGYSKCS